MNVYVTSKGQIVIPSSIRKKYGLKPGTRVLISESKDGIVLTPVTEHFIHALKGTLKGSGALEALISERQKDKLKEE